MAFFTQKYLSALSMDISKRIKWIKKSHREISFFCILFQSTHQVGMKNVVECYKDFFGYFNGDLALEIIKTEN